MSTVETKTRYRPEDLLTMPGGDRYELLDGQLVEGNMGQWSSYVAGQTYRLLADFCLDNPQGWVFPEGTSYQCFPAAPERVRRADVSFIRLGRQSLAEVRAEGHTRIAPDLAVEVVSPNDTVYDIDTKVQDFLQAGVRLVWVVNPEVRTVEVHRPTGPGAILRENDELT